MAKEKYSKDEFLMMFKEDVIRLSKYIPWLESKKGDDVANSYEDGDKMAHTLTFPVYDSILMSFLNEASTTVFMDSNYRYLYTRKNIKDYKDELRLIESADIMHMEILQCILSRYVFGGMTKAYLWRDGVEHGTFVAVVKKARQIVEFWDQPLVIEDEILPEEEAEEPVEELSLEEAEEKIQTEESVEESVEEPLEEVLEDVSVEEGSSMEDVTAEAVETAEAIETEVEAEITE